MPERAEIHVYAEGADKEPLMRSLLFEMYHHYDFSRNVYINQEGLSVCHGSVTEFNLGRFYLAGIAGFIEAEIEGCTAIAICKGWTGRADRGTCLDAALQLADYWKTRVSDKSIHYRDIMKRLEKYARP